MNEALKQFSEQLALELKGKLSSEGVAEFVKAVNASGAEDVGTFEFIVSTRDMDRQGDALDQSKWDLTRYKLNPVVLDSHEYTGIGNIIGVCTDIFVDSDDNLRATGKWAPTAKGQEARVLYDGKYLRACSAGYMERKDGMREMLEFSPCPVPANPFALSTLSARFLTNVSALKTKGFFYEVVAKAAQVGDDCELDDGSPGVLAEDAGDPGKLTCVPRENKSNETNMNDEMEKKLKAEHGRHAESVGKAIDEFSGKCMKGEKAEGTLDKAIQEYTKAIEGEQADHLEKCMKAIDESYELQDQAKKAVKSIDEFKAAMTDEHLNHVKACDKAIDEFKAEPGYSDEEKKKAIDEFTKAMGDELGRHEKCHAEMCKAEGEGEDGGKGEKKAAEETLTETEEQKAIREAELELKSGRTISAKTKEKVDAVIKALEEHDAEHSADIQKHIASLKELSSSPQEDEGKEPKADEKSAEAPKPRSSTSGANADLETYLLSQRLVRQVKTATEGVLRQLNSKIKELSSRGS